MTLRAIALLAFVSLAPAAYAQQAEPAGAAPAPAPAVGEAPAPGATPAAAPGAAALPASLAPSPAVLPPPSILGPSPEFPGLRSQPLSRGTRWGLAIVEGPIGYSILQNRLAYHLTGNPEVYDVSWSTFTDHLNGPWWYDQDQFATNQFGHPYEGSMYYTAGRSLGLSVYESWIVAELGSLTWELAAETEPPSVNDQITTPIAGTILGEVLYRLSGRILDAMSPGFLREFSAFAVSPFHGFNRQVVGDYRPHGLNDQPWFGQMKLSVGLGGRASTSGESDHRAGGAFAVQLRAQNGNPGGDWEFRQPFDYYDAAVSLILDSNSTTKSAYGNILMRAMVLGDDYGEGRSRGLWGMMAAYDYLTPGSFRVSSSNLTLGTVGQIAFRPDLALQGTAYAGPGYGAGGSASEPAGSRDYHFGVQLASLLEARLLWGYRGFLRVAGRGYYTSGKVSPETDTFELIGYTEVELLARVYGPNAISLTAVGARRRAQYPDRPDVFSSARELNVSWTLLTDRFFGVGR